MKSRAFITVVLLVLISSFVLPTVASTHVRYPETRVWARDLDLALEIGFDPPVNPDRIRFEPLFSRERTAYALVIAKETDNSTGLTDFGARPYDADLARFTTVDPIAGIPSEPRSLQRYAYGFSNPFSYVDPNGLAVILSGKRINELLTDKTDPRNSRYFAMNKLKEDLIETVVPDQVKDLLWGREKNQARSVFTELSSMSQQIDPNRYYLLIEEGDSYSNIFTASRWYISDQPQLVSQLKTRMKGTYSDDHPVPGRVLDVSDLVYNSQVSTIQTAEKQAVGIQGANNSFVNDFAKRYQTQAAIIGDSNAPIRMTLETVGMFTENAALDVTSGLGTFQLGRFGLTIFGKSVLNAGRQFAKTEFYQFLRSETGAININPSRVVGELDPILLKQKELSQLVSKQGAVIDRWLSSSNNRWAKLYRKNIEVNPNFAKGIRGRILDIKMRELFRKKYGDIPGIRIDQTILGTGSNLRPDLYFPNIGGRSVIFDVGSPSKVADITKYEGLAEEIIPLIPVHWF